MSIQRIGHALRRFTAAIVCSLIVGIDPGYAAADFGREVEFDIEPQDLPAALLKFSAQSGVQVTSPGTLIEGRNSQGVSGLFDAREALERVLAHTGLEYEVIDENTVLIVPSEALAAGNGRRIRLSQAEQREPGDAVSRSDVPEVVVTATRNMDIARSRDDALPFVVIDREQISRSGASSFYDFMRNMPQNSSATLAGVSAGFAAFSSGPMRGSLNLRGLGADETLILLNGRRTSKGGQGSGQLALNAIPASLIERIEYLPASASAIYGADATGGVVNIVTRTGYRGGELALSYGNTTDANARRLAGSLTAGLGLNEDRTNVLLTLDAQYDRNLVANDRNYHLAARRRLLAQAPEIIFGVPGSSVNPVNPWGNTPNVFMPVNGQTIPGADTPYASVPEGTTGPIPASAFVDTFNLEQDRTSNRLGGLTELQPEFERNTAALSVSHRLTDQWELFFESSFSALETRSYADEPWLSVPRVLDMPANSPFNPFGVPVRVAVVVGDLDERGLIADNEETSVALGASGTIADRWQATVDASYSRSFAYSDVIQQNFRILPQLVAGTHPQLPGMFYNPLLDFNSGARNDPAVIEQLRMHRSFRFDTHAKQIDLRVNGAPGRSWGGDWQLAAGLEARIDEVTDTNLSHDVSVSPNAVTGPVTFPIPDNSRTSTAAYLEATVPLFGAGNRRTGLERLELKVAGRYERSNDFAASFNPQVALRYQPVNSLTLRASYGTGFVAPTFAQLAPPIINQSPFTIFDPRRNETYALDAGQVHQLGSTGGLGPERSRSTGFGLIYQPLWAADLRLSADAYWIRKFDNITGLSAPLALQNEALLAGRVTRVAPEPGASGGVGVITRLDLSNLNATELETAGIDLTAEYSLPTAIGNWYISGAFTHVDRYRVQTVFNGPTTEFVGRGAVEGGNESPLRWRGRMDVVWRHSAWEAGVAWRFLDSYRPTLNPFFARGLDGEEIASSSELDLRLSYSFEEASIASAWFGGIVRSAKIVLNVTNLLDREPPLMTDLAGFSTYNDPRQRFYSLTLRSSF